MKSIPFKDIVGNRLSIDPSRVDFVREYVQKSDGGVDIEITVLVQIGQVSIPVDKTYEETCKLLGFNL